jgi:RNA polymerase sigma factor (sigma-70 family)
LSPPRAEPTVSSTHLPSVHQQVEALYSHHHGWLRGWLGRKLGDSHQAADLAHDTFMRLLAREEALALQEPRAFLTTVAQRVLANHWRRQQLERAYLEALASVPPALAPSEEERAAVLQTLLEVDRLLNGLPLPVKRAFLLSQLDGLSHAEVAEALGISIATVKRHLVKAAGHCQLAGAAEASTSEPALGPLLHLAPPLKSAVVRATLTPPRSVARRRAVGTLVVLFAGGAAWSLREEAGWRQWVADHRTGAGERRTVLLDDGTTLVLNTASAVNVVYTATQRRLRLIAGEVLITTARDAAARPFLVETAQGEAQALGTRYSVRLHDGATDVAVFEGTVRLTPRHAAGQAQVLQAGQQARFTADAIAAPRLADPQSTAWTEGFIVAKGMRLADFLAELGRHSPHALSCDPAVADLRVSGSYPLNDIDKVLDTLSAMLSLQVETVTRFWGWRTEGVRLVPRPSA